jgi:hypothetical protein
MNMADTPSSNKINITAASLHSSRPKRPWRVERHVRNKRNKKIERLKRLKHYVFEENVKISYNEDGSIDHLHPTREMIEDFEYYLFNSDNTSPPPPQTKPKVVELGFNSENTCILTAKDLGKGCCCWTTAGQLIGAFLPRHESVNIAGDQGLTDQANFMRWLLKDSNKKFRHVARGRKRFVRTKSKYVILGNMVAQGGKGKERITTHLPDPADYFTSFNNKEQREHRVSALATIMQICNHCKDAFQRLSLPVDIQRLTYALLAVKCNTKVLFDGIWPSMAVSCNSQSRIHVDRDMFYSILYALIIPSTFRHREVTREAVRCNRSPRHLKPVQYFCFPTFNLAIPILPQSYFVFNPTLPHGASAVVDSAQFHEVYLCSLYLKSAVVGGNDNTKKLTLPQKQILHSLSPQISELKLKQRTQTRKH